MLSEKETKKKYIDQALKKVGWTDQYVKLEVNPVKSDFKNKNFVHYGGTVEKGVDLFIDYLLLDKNNNPLAIIEAKKTSKDPTNGRIQARTYANEVEKQIDDKMPIFLTNGLKWKFIDEYGRERDISSPFSQDDLKRRRDLYNTRSNPATEKINSNIVDRSKSVQIVRKLSEHFSEGHREALIEMATGTGKTRVAMAIIDILIKSNIVRNVLFIADRGSLVKQARENGFKKFFNEPVADLREGYDDTSRLYVSTIQTLMSGNKNQPKFFEKYSSGFFDLIVFDEAHRSIFDKNNLVFKYFDAIKIGLTATPKDADSRSTFDLFGNSVAEYSYDQAINDGVLVPYKAHVIKTDVLTEGISSEDLDEFAKDDVRRQGADPENIELTGSQFDRLFMDEKTNDLVIKTFLDACYKSDEGKPAKTIFFCSSQKHAKWMKERFNKLYPLLSSDVQVITSEMYRSEDEVSRFQKNSSPRIALSVGMLDTGVDIPEVCNLVFVQPVFSHIRFWQMLGRGTRNEVSCKHKDWLPDRHKADFLIFDFVIGGHSNIEYHELHQGSHGEAPESKITAIFNNRVDLLERDLSPDYSKLINQKLQNTLNTFRDDLFVVTEKRDIIEKLRKVEDLSNHVEELKTEIAPLTKYIEGTNANVTTFIFESEKLFGYVLDRNMEDIAKTKQVIQFKVRKVLEKDNITAIQEKSDDLKKVLHLTFWEDLTFDRVEFLVKEIAPTMVYFVPEKNPFIIINKEDKIIDWEETDKEIAEDEKLKRLLEESPEVRKLKNGEGITSEELLNLEKKLSALRPEITIYKIQRSRGTDFITFLREIIGLTREEDPRTLIEKRFDKLILEEYPLNNHITFNSKQLEYLIMLKKVFAERKHVELKDLTEEPLGEGKRLFETVDLINIINTCNTIKMC